MNAVRTYRVVVRGELTDVDDDQRATLLAEIDKHDLLVAGYSETGDLTYDESLRPFTVRCLLVQPADRPDQDAVDHGLLTAITLLESRGLAYQHLRATATCLEDIKIRRPRRTAS
ncbi:DUF6204 family protein [Kribbella sp. NPDC051952]|uniref:DUF6204 family protein n=1 Tax=Kribbella sp. NPDC051952 TaxID=3154851 RepID=UPI0034431EB4